MKRSYQQPDLMTTLRVIENEISDPAAGAQIARRQWIESNDMPGDTNDRRERQATEAEDVFARAEERRE